MKLESTHTHTLAHRSRPFPSTFQLLKNADRDRARSETVRICIIIFRGGAAVVAVKRVTRDDVVFMRESVCVVYVCGLREWFDGDASVASRCGEIYEILTIVHKRRRARRWSLGGAYLYIVHMHGIRVRKWRAHCMNEER